MKLRHTHRTRLWPDDLGFFFFLFSFQISHDHICHFYMGVPSPPLPGCLKPHLRPGARIRIRQSRTQSISFTEPALPLRLVLSLVPQLFFSYCAGLTERFQSAGILVPRAGSSCTREGEPERTLGRIYCCLVPSRSLAHYKGGKF